MCSSRRTLSGLTHRHMGRLCPTCAAKISISTNSPGGKSGHLKMGGFRHKRNGFRHIIEEGSLVVLLIRRGSYNTFAHKAIEILRVAFLKEDLKPWIDLPLIKLWFLNPQIRKTHSTILASSWVFAGKCLFNVEIVLSNSGSIALRTTTGTPTEHRAHTCGKN